jgi:hypothetical protein
VIYERRRKMKKGEFATKGLYAGTGTGIILFLLMGMFPGSLIGGAVGLMISSALFGPPVEPTIMPRIILVLSMVTGVLTSAAVFVVGLSVSGWAIGAAIDTVQMAKEGAPLVETAKEHAKS